MNGKDIFLGLSHVDSRYIEEAEFGLFHPEKEELPDIPKYRRFRRPLLVAAIVALTLLLAGCAVVYVMHLRDVKVGSREVQREVFDNNFEFQGYETVTEHVLSLSGLDGSPNFLAAQAWFDFKESYDPDHSIYYANAENSGDQFLDYRPYNVYSQEMADKVEELLRTYGLEKLGRPVEAHSAKRLMAYLGIDSPLNPDSSASLYELKTATYYPGGTFATWFYLEDAGLPYRPDCYLRINSKTTFDPDFCYLEDIENWQEWNYKTAAGDQVLILRHPDQEYGWVLCDRPDAMVSLRLNTALEVLTDENGYPEALKTPMTDGQVEQVVEAINWKLSPTPGDPALLTLPATRDTSNLSQTQNGVTITVKKVETDGLTAKVLLGIEAPEGTVLPKGGDDEGYIDFGNRGVLSCELPRGIGGGPTRYIDQDDGDGKDNTTELLIEDRIDFRNGEDTYRPGDPWSLYLTDLSVRKWNREAAQNDILLEVEGAWEFDIAFSEEDDYRKLEFVEEPVTTQVVHGWYANGDDAFTEATITSLQVRRFSWDVTFQEGQDVGGAELYSPRNGKYTYVVLKDGTQIDLNFDDQDFPLEEIDHLVLMSETTLYPRWVE